MPDGSPPTRAPRTARARISVERAGPQHSEALQLFFKKEWGGDGGPIDFSIPQWVCTRNDEAIGYLGTIPATFRLDGERVEATWLKGFWVTEKYRSGPVGPMLLKQAASELDLIGSQVVAPAARRVQEAEGFTHRCTLFNRVLLTRADRVLDRVDLERVGLKSLPGPLRATVGAVQRTGAMKIAGALAGLGIRALGAVTATGAGRYVVRSGFDDATALDRVWERLRDQVHTTPDRSASALQERYGSDGRHELFSVWSDDTLEGWSILRRPGASTDPRLSGLRIASLADIFYPLETPAVGVAALRAAERSAREHGADAVLCSGSHPALARLVARRGYVNFPGNVLIMARDGQDHTFATGGEKLWVTRGDARSDEGF